MIKVLILINLGYADFLKTDRIEKKSNYVHS